MSDFDLRRYRHEHDYPHLVALWQAAGLRHESAGRDSPAAIRRQVASGSAVYLVAEADARLVGALLATHDGRKGWLNRAAVLPDWQRRGVISALVSEAERCFLDAGIDVFACLVENGNEVSMAGCAKLGYEPGAITYFRKRHRADA